MYAETSQVTYVTIVPWEWERDTASLGHASGIPVGPPWKKEDDVFHRCPFMLADTH